MAFPKLASLLGLASTDATVTDENMRTAEAKIASLESSVTAAELRATNAEAALATMTTRATTAEGSLATAQGDLKTAQTSLATAQGQVKTLEDWKKNHASATDEREEDESNQREQGEPQATYAWEKRAESAIASRK